jgi:transcriptional regulator with XRE-family HTH domain
MGDVVEFRTAPPKERLWREALGEQLRDERAQRGERIVEVAERASVSPQYLSELERGKKEASSEVVAALADALDLTAVELVRRASGRLTVRSTTARSSGPVCLAA